MSSGKTRIVVTGAAGRMGSLMLGLAADAVDLAVAGATERPGHPWLGQDVGTCLGREPMDCPVTDDLAALLSRADVVVDFTCPKATLEFLTHIRASSAGLVCGTTGLSAEDKATLRELGKSHAVVFAPNMSLGVNVLLSMVRRASALLGPEYDLEVLELHHKHKKDSPSGTALALIESGLAPRGGDLASALTVRNWGETGPRKGAEEVGVAALRGGDVAGEHTVFFFGQGERLELTHRAGDRRAFARGALRAARWLVDQPAGFYGMVDVLGLHA